MREISICDTFLMILCLRPNTSSHFHHNTFAAHQNKRKIESIQIKVFILFYLVIWAVNVAHPYTNNICRTYAAVYDL